MNASELLANTLSPDAALRTDAVQKLENASRENFPAYMLMLSAELGNETSPPHVRNAAGLALKNALTAKESARSEEYSNRWLAVPPDTRSKIKHDSLIALGSSVKQVGTVAAQLVAAIAAVELPSGQWPELVELLLSFMGQSNVNLRVATLQAIGFICESIDPSVLSQRSNEILTAVVHGARKDEPSSDVQFAAITALKNSLDFVRDNFEREGERNYIMQVVCEATQNSSSAVQVAAFECLVAIMAYYYHYMSFYMEQALFGLTVLGMKHPDSSVAMQAVEFWSTVCDEEINLNKEALQASEYGETPELESKNFAKVALPELVPVLLTLMTRQEEDADEDEWNISMSASYCLGALSQAVQDPIVAAVMPFIESNIRSEDWHFREAAVMAFSCILDGPDPSLLNNLVNSALPILIHMMADSDLQVKDTVAWTLGKVCDVLVQTIQPDVHLQPLVVAFVNGLKASPRIAANCCWGLQNLAEGMGAYSELTMTSYYEGVIQALLVLTESASNEANYRTAAYECLATWVTNSSAETRPQIENLSNIILQRMEHLISVHNQILGMDDRNNWNDLQSNFCSVLISIVRKFGHDIKPRADRIMTLILQLISLVGKVSTVLEDAFLVVGTLASALEQDFSPYISAFLQFLFPALKAHEDSQLCTIAVGIIGDISRALGDKTKEYSAGFMQLLSENLQSNTLNRDAKIPILECFGDIALAIGPAFEDYLDHTMNVLRQAGSITPNPMDYELQDYLSVLREGILEAYTGIITAFKGTEQVRLLQPHIQDILELVKAALLDENHSDPVYGLAHGIIGDLAEIFGSQIKPLLLQDWLAAELKSRRCPPESKQTMRWAREMVKRATV